MKKNLFILSIAIYLLIGVLGCNISTTGKGGWEIYTGVRVYQEGDKPANVKIESTVVDKVIDSLTDGEVSDEE